MLDNVDVAILSKVNALAERRGLKPYDFVATVKSGGDESDTALTFEVPASGNALREERFAEMLHDLGISADRSQLRGTPEQLIDALDHALTISSRWRHRF